jgi:hypothetical protein
MPDVPVAFFLSFNRPVSSARAVRPRLAILGRPGGQTSSSGKPAGNRKPYRADVHCSTRARRRIILSLIPALPSRVIHAVAGFVSNPERQRAPNLFKPFGWQSWRKKNVTPRTDGGSESASFNFGRLHKAIKTEMAERRTSLIRAGMVPQYVRALRMRLDNGLLSGSH